MLKESFMLKICNALLLVTILMVSSCKLVKSKIEVALSTTDTSSETTGGSGSGSGSGSGPWVAGAQHMFMLNMDTTLSSSNGKILYYNTVSQALELASSSYNYRLRNPSGNDVVIHPGEDTKFYYSGESDPGNSLYDYLVFDTATHSLTVIGVTNSIWNSFYASGRSLMYFDYVNAPNKTKIYPGSGAGAVDANTYFSLDGITFNLNSQLGSLGKGYFLAFNDGSDASKLLVLHSDTQTKYNVSSTTEYDAGFSFEFKGTNDSGALFTVRDNNSNLVRLYHLKYSPYTLTLVFEVDAYDYFSNAFPLPDGGFIIGRQDTTLDTDEIFRVSNAGVKSIIRSESSASSVAGSLSTCGFSNLYSGYTNLTGQNMYIICNSSGNTYLYDITITTNAITRYLIKSGANLSNKFALHGNNLYIVDTDGALKKNYTGRRSGHTRRR